MRWINGQWIGLGLERRYVKKYPNMFQHFAPMSSSKSKGRRMDEWIRMVGCSMIGWKMI